MIQKFTPEDYQEDDNDNHRQTWYLIGKPMDTEDDVEFTEQEVANVIEDMSKKEATWEDGIPNVAWKWVMKILPIHDCNL
jgi:hypothetical protein